jgi:hypothetical protein
MTSRHATAVAATGPALAGQGILDARWIGLVWEALAVASFSGWFVATRKLRISDIAALRFGIGAILLALLAASVEIVLQAVCQGVLTRGTVFVTNNRAASLPGLAAATDLIALVPAVASILAIFVPGETRLVPESVSLAIVVLGVLLASRPFRLPIAPNIPQR